MGIMGSISKAAGQFLGLGPQLLAGDEPKAPKASVTQAAQPAPTSSVDAQQSSASNGSQAQNGESDTAEDSDSRRRRLLSSRGIATTPLGVKSGPSRRAVAFGDRRLGV